MDSSGLLAWGLLDRGTDVFRGDRLSGAPQQQGSLLASYAKRLGGEVAFDVQYGYSYIGDVLTRIGMRAGGERLPAYDLHNVSASFSGDAWTLTFYADNLFDEYAVTGARQTPDLIATTRDGFRSRRYFANVLAPRRIGVRMRYTLWQEPHDAGCCATPRPRCGTGNSTKPRSEPFAWTRRDHLEVRTPRCAGSSDGRAPGPGRVERRDPPATSRDSQRRRHAAFATRESGFRLPNVIAVVGAGG